MSRDFLSEFKERIRKIDRIEIPKGRFDSEDNPPAIPLYEIRKITLPIDPKFPQGQVIIYGIPVREADWWLEFKLKMKSYHDDTTDMKTLVMYEKFPINGTPKERDIYSNPARFCTEEFPDLKTPRRIN